MSHSFHHSEQEVLQSNVFCILRSLSITNHSTGIFPCHQLPSVRTFYFKVQIHLQVLKRCFAPLESVHRDLFTPTIGVKHGSDNTSPGSYSPASNSSASITTAAYSSRTKCHSSGHINSTHFGHNSSKFCHSTRPRAEESPAIGTKNVCSFKHLSHAEELYFI